MTVRIENIKLQGKILLLLQVVFILPFFGFSQSDTIDIDTAETSDEYYSDTIPPDEEVNYFTPIDENINATGTDSGVRHLPDSIIETYKNDKAFWYADGNWKVPKEKIVPGQKYQAPFYTKEWFSKLVWIIMIGCFIAVVIWYLSLNDASIFRQKNKALAGIEEAKNNENIFEINYSKEISGAVDDKNYRLAIRLLFLRLLKSLSEKEIIHYKQDRTNMDYLFELNKTGYYNDFFRLTRSYEQAWYGYFDISDENYHSVKTAFDDFDKQLN